MVPLHPEGGRLSGEWAALVAWLDRLDRALAGARPTGLHSRGSLYLPWSK